VGISDLEVVGAGVGAGWILVFSDMREPGYKVLAAQEVTLRLSTC
jgi:hypothetical protein